jgi:hypothetical protein
MKIIKYIKSKSAIITVMVLTVSVNLGCKKFIDVPPPTTSINAENVFKGDATASAVLNGIYTRLSQSNTLSEDFLGLSVLTSLSSDELTLADPSNSLLLSYYTNNLRTLYGGSLFWQQFYTNIYSVNSAIEGINASTSLTPIVKQQLLGEAKFLRGLFYFYLVNLYGDLPLALNSDYKENSTLNRLPKLQIYQQIIKDLTEAQSELNSKYLMGDALTPYPGGSEERVRPNSAVATALLARVYLYLGDITKDQENYRLAEQQATLIIDNPLFTLSTNLEDVFLKTSPEAIWQLQPVNGSFNTSEAQLFILPNDGPNMFYPVILSNNFVSEFEQNDHRKTSWVGKVTAGGTDYYYPIKYKVNLPGSPVTEYSTIFRLSEQYLIRAEAEAQQGSLSSANDDLNIIRNRAGLESKTSTTKIDLLSTILKERKMELFTEYGQRWLDLKRTGKVDLVMPIVSPRKGGSWNPQWSLYPIPQVDINTNPNLRGNQNPGY